ncbi:MAG: cell division protein FtsW [Deltaproteobacteria bacterium RBG_19FT_COMBO_46_9]|nr:MAG: cell division protein FtsW [Deltaproteobacteria bacterium RBG_19FT_COMBO_46_9]
MSIKGQSQGGYDYLILIPTIVLLGIGLVAIYSASSFLAGHELGDSYFYLKRQASFGLLGLCLLVIAKNIPVSLYRIFAYPALIVSFILLVLLFFPGMGRSVRGACRWLSIAGFSLQPSELAKLSLAVYIAYSMSKKGTNMSSFSQGLLPHVIVAGAFMFLILLQPDLGTTVIIGCWLLIILFVGGLNLFYLLSMIFLSSLALSWLIWQADYRMNRWLAFIHPWEDPQGLSYQIIHSFLAFGSGGVLGVGLGNSKQKLGYLPDLHTDFILPIMGEELGLLGVIAIIMLFGVLIIRGIKIALDAPDLYSCYLGMGISTMIGLQVIINMGVVMGLLPTKGLTLPLLSYGGSSLIISLLSIGILLSISARRQV